MRQNALNKISFNKLIRPKNTMIQKRIQRIQHQCILTWNFRVTIVGKNALKMFKNMNVYIIL
jgi:hypothetical protein